MLEGHSGCVNTLRWNKTGALLASGSDDRNVKIWKSGREIHNLVTGHEGNVFAVEFLQNSGDQKLVTGAADRVVALHDIEASTCKKWELDGRVKRICTVEHDPTLFWAAVECDNGVQQFDTRTENPEVIIRHTADREFHDAKSVAVSEARPNLIVVGFDETAVRLYDRRNLNAPMLTFSPLGANTYAYHATHVAFNKRGTEVVVNHGGGGGVYVFSVDAELDPKYMDRFHSVMELPREPVITSGALPYPDLREIGSTAIREKHFAKAIDFYSDLIYRNDDRESHQDHRAFLSVCHSNRATALLLRRQRGDTYACVRDCIKALEIHRGNSKALLRLIKSFTTMEHIGLARKCVQKFKEWYPNDTAIEKMEEDVEALTPNDRPELVAPEGVVDYQERYGGSTNHQTDIKEANFFGSRDQYIIAGSDCGHMYIWNRDTSKIQGIFEADDHILNICQPHPDQFMIATAGIDDDILLWQPILERPDAFLSRRVEDPYEFMEKRADGMGGRIHLHMLRDLARDNSQCVQS